MKGQSNRRLFNSVVTGGVALAIICSYSAIAESTGAAPGAGGGGDRGKATVSLKIAPAKQNAALAYWTRERISAAPVMVMPIDSGSGEVDATALEEPLSLGFEGESDAGAAAPGATDLARAVYASDWLLDESEAPDPDPDLGSDMLSDIPLGTPGVYTSFDVNREASFANVYPHRWMGRLTFNVPGGSSSCSATAISGNNIVTAAHCVYDTGANRWYSNWAFSPAYRNGSTPYGTFAATSCTILTAWVNLSGGFSINSWTRHDVAVCTMGRNSAGQTLNQAVGWAGRLWNAGYTQLDFNSGYPAQDYRLVGISDPAQYLRACINESFQQTTETLGGGCNWGPGISGGSWLIGYKPFVVSGQVNSVNSGLYVNQQNIYGARFNSNNIVPLCNARGC